jgi:hypothetical protein
MASRLAAGLARARRLGTGLVLSLLGACSSDGGDLRQPPDDGSGDADASAGMTVHDAAVPACAFGSVTCDGTTALECTPSGLSRRSCREGQVCAEGLGCVACKPYASWCDGDLPRRCSADGTEWVAGTRCTGELSCDGQTGECVNLCARAASSKSYVGCEYWPVTLGNSVSKEFEFAVVVSNPQSVAADYTLEGEAGFSSRGSIPARSTQTLRLPWQALGGLAYTGTAYHLVTTLPVIAYQFSPLEYAKAGDCVSPEHDDMRGDRRCFSFSNDASLLLPTPALTGTYMISSRPSHGGFYQFLRGADGSTLVDGSGRPLSRHYLTGSGIPEFVIVGADSAEVQVSIKFAGEAEGAPRGMRSVFQPGQEITFPLAPGRALQFFAGKPAEDACKVGSKDEARYACVENQPRFQCLETLEYCAPDARYDLTGTVIRASGKLAVYMGDVCSFVPYDRQACDHLEESAFPLETWGKRVFVAGASPLRNEPSIVRVLSGAADNRISFTPAVHAPVTLGLGAFVELESDEDFVVEGSGALSVVQYLVGQNYAGVQTAVERELRDEIVSGDPSLTQVPPIEQYRREYFFLAPDTYDESWLVVSAPDAARVQLDGRMLDAWKSVPGSGMKTCRAKISGGAHQVTGDQAFGIQVQGFGSYTSYMYPGGLELQQISTPLF